MAGVSGWWSGRGFGVVPAGERRDQRDTWHGFSNALSHAFELVATTVLFVLPPNQVAGYTFAGALALLCAYWIFWMRARFKGPPVRDI